MEPAGDVEVGGEVEVKCNGGYLVEGDTVLTCTEELEYEGTGACQRMGRFTEKEIIFYIWIENIVHIYL